MSKPSTQRIAIIGGGPIGLEAALYARSLNLPVQLFEAGAFGGHVERWGFLKMFSPFGMNVTALGRATLHREAPMKDLPADTDLLTGRAFREAYLLPLAQSLALKGSLFPETRVLLIGRNGARRGEATDPKKPLSPFKLLIRGNDNKERVETADIILDCTGTFSRPNWLGEAGIPAVGELASRQFIPYWPEDVLGVKRAAYANKSILVVGGGYTAATAVCDLAHLAETEQSTWIIWLTNGPKAPPLPRLANDPLKERDRLAAKANHLAARCDANLEYHALSQIEEVYTAGQDQGFRVVGKVNGKPQTWEVERLLAHVGYRPDLTMSNELRVLEPIGRIETEEPGYFVLGSKAMGRDSNFLLRDGHEQIRRAFAIITAKPGLNQYTAKAA